MIEQLLAHLFGDYLLQSDWMAQNKTKRDLPAFVHALLYSLCFLPLLWSSRWPFNPPRLHGFDLMGWWVIFYSHFIIDRFRLARYVVWAKNWLGPQKHWHFIIGHKVGAVAYWTDHEGPDEFTDIAGVTWSRVPSATVIKAMPPLSGSPNGYPPTTPVWLSTWLLIIADNTLHLTINYLALRYL